MGRYDFLLIIVAGFSQYLAIPLPLGAPVFRFDTHRYHALDPDHLLCGALAATCQRNQQDLPGSCMALSIYTLCSLTPLDRLTLASSATVDVAFHCEYGVGSRIAHFEAQSHSSQNPCVLFAATFTRIHATLGSGCWLGFLRAGFPPARSTA